MVRFFAWRTCPVSDTLPPPSALSGWMNASGFFGYTPPTASILSDRAGAFVTPAISKSPRSPSRSRCLVEYPGGFLLHTGYPNDGFTKVVKQYARKWAGLKMPVWPHLIVRNGYECSQMVRALETFENIGAIEVSLPADAEPSFVEEILQAALGELPLYISVPFLAAWQNWLDLFRLYTVSGIVLSAPRGSLIANDSIISGRLYGPSLFPQLLEKLTTYQGCGIPLVAGSGIFSIEQGTLALQAGASAVQLDACLWQLSAPTSPSKS